MDALRKQKKWVYVDILIFNKELLCYSNNNRT